MTFHRLLSSTPTFTQHVTRVDPNGYTECYERNVSLKEIATAAADHLSEMGYVTFRYVHDSEKIRAVLSLRPVQTEFGEITTRYHSDREFMLYTEIQRIIKLEMKMPGTFNLSFYNEAGRTCEINRTSITAAVIEIHRPGR